MQLPEEILNEVKFKTNRSSGSGGQNVNKVETRVSLTFDVDNSQVLTGKQKEIIRIKLAGRINKSGLLQIHCETERSQLANKKKVKDRFIALLQKALKPVVPRKKTKVPVSVKEARLKKKKITSEKKQRRRDNSGLSG